MCAEAIRFGRFDLSTFNYRLSTDSHAGLYDFPAREYSIQGRWPSPDPAGLAAVDPSNPQSWNRYAYVVNRPLNLTDPTGLCPNWGPFIQKNGRLICTSARTGITGPDGFAGGCSLDGMDASCSLVQTLVQAGATNADPSTFFGAGNGDFLAWLGGDCVTAPAVGGGTDKTCENGEWVSLGTAGGGSSGGGNSSGGGSSLDDPANALAHAINKTGVQTLANPCAIALWYGASAGGALAISSTEAGGALFPYTKDAIDALKVWYSLADEPVRSMVRYAASAGAFVAVRVAQGCGSVQ